MNKSPPQAPVLFREAVDQLRRRGVILTLAPGEFIVNFHKGASSTEYRTDDLADALEHGLQLSQVPAEPPLGPLGKGKLSRRALMYRHNRKLAAKRQKADKH